MNQKQPEECGQPAGSVLQKSVEIQDEEDASAGAFEASIEKTAEDESQPSPTISPPIVSPCVPGSFPVPTLLFCNRPEWDDVTPIYNSAAEDDVVRIAVTEEFADAFAYMRAMLQSDERSARALELTAACVRLNPANYSVWQYRRNCLRSLGKCLRDELCFVDATIIENQKNYQVWHHRRIIVEELNDSSGEFDFINQVLDDDSKNYHAWQYRHWLVEHFVLYSQSELDYASQLITSDVCNNSAWNYRYFLVASLSDCFKNRSMVDAEIKYTLEAILEMPTNESSWSYLSGILLNDGLTSRVEVLHFCKRLAGQQPPCRSPHLYNFLVDCCVERIEQKEVTDTKILEKEVAEAQKLLDLLIELDPIRVNFWNYRKSYVANLFESVSAMPTAGFSTPADNEISEPIAGK